MVLSTQTVLSSSTWRSTSNTAFRAGEDLQFVLKWGVVTGGRSTLTRGYLARTVLAELPADLREFLVRTCVFDVLTARRCDRLLAADEATAAYAGTSGDWRCETAAMAELRVALVGYGMAGRDFHAPLLRQVDGLRVTHVVTGDPERAAAAKEENPGARVLPAFEEIWPLSGQIDVVVLASPTNVHAQQAREALRRDLATQFLALYGQAKA